MSISNTHTRINNKPTYLAYTTTTMTKKTAIDTASEVITNNTGNSEK